MGTMTSETDDKILRLEEASKQNVECAFKSECKNTRNLYIKYRLQMFFSNVILSNIRVTVFYY